MKKNLKVSILVPTERPDLIGWVKWVVNQQTYKNTETLVVNGHDMTIGAKRNACLEDAEGDYVVWFDDDDWQHPDKVQHLVRAVEGGALVAGFDDGWFFRPADCHVRHYKAKSVLPAASCIVEINLARSVRFDEKMKVGEDTRWIEQVLRRAEAKRLHSDTPHALWMRHGRNTSPDREDGWAPMTASLAARLPAGWSQYLGVFSRQPTP